MKLVAIVFICFAAATILDTSQALRRIKRNPSSIANATKLGNNEFVELRLIDKGDELNLKEQREANAATSAANAVQQANFKDQQDDAQLLRNQQPNNNEQNTNGEQHQPMQEANNNNNNNGQQQQQKQQQQQQQQQQRFNGKQQQDGRPLYLGNNALAYLLQNKANHKMNGMAGRFSIEGDRGGNTAKVVLVGGSNGDGGGGGGVPFAACNARKNSNANLHGNENNENNNNNGNNYNNNNNNDNNGNSNNNNNNNNNFDNMNGNNYDPDRKPTTGSEQLQLENPMHQNQQSDTATCAAPQQQQQQQLQQQQQQQQHFQLQKQNHAQMLQLPNLSAAPGQSSIVLSISRTGITKPEEINMKSISPENQNGQMANGISKFEPMGNVLKLANMLIYKLDNFPPFRTAGQQFYLGPNANGGAPIAGIPDNEDFDTSMDYLYNPLDNNQHAPLVTNTGASPSSISIPIMPPFLFQPQFGVHEQSSMQPINLIENALDKFITNGVVETDDGGAGDGEELELRCPVHHETIKRNGTAGNELRDDVLQVCSCRLFKKKKNAGGFN